MQITIIITGILILVTAFTYSAIITLGRTDAIVQGETGMRSSRESLSIADYQDGTYAASVKYEVPYGYVESMDTTITIVDGVVTESDVTFEIVNPVSNSYVDSFMRYYEDKVVGQQVTDINLSRVGGASLTNVAFDTALEKMLAEASGDTMDDDVKNAVVPITLPEITYGRPEDAIPVGSTENRIHLVQGPLSAADAPTGQVQEKNSSSPYADGVYVVEQEYYAWPNLFEPMQTTITLDDGIIVDAVQKYATVDYSHSIKYQKHFDSLYKKVVIGMPIDNVPIARVGQASETTDGFNDALLAIKKRAQN